MSGDPNVLAIRGGRLIDPANGRDEVGDLFVSGGKIVNRPPSGAGREIDAAGQIVCPGFVEPHAVAAAGGVSRRWAKQALAGGFTTVATAGASRRERDDRGPCPRLLWIAPLTVPDTRRLAEMADAAAAGAVAFSDLPAPHADSELLRRGLLYAKMLGLPVFELPRDPALSAGGVAAEGAVAEELGLFAIPAAAERVAVRRGIELANATGGRLHFTALSDGGAMLSVDEFRAASLKEPPPVSAAVPVTHLLCTAEALRGFDPAGRVDPPFRDEADRAVLVEQVAGAGFSPSSVACLTSGHRPDPGLLDPVDLLAAPPGYEAFETALSVAWTALDPAEPGRLIGLLTAGPANLLGRTPPSLAAGEPADLAIFDPSADWICDPESLAVPVARTPLAGKRLRGRVTYTVLGGEVVFEHGSFPESPAG